MHTDKHIYRLTQFSGKKQQLIKCHPNSHFSYHENLQHHNNQTAKTVHGTHGIKDVYLLAHSPSRRFL